MKKFIKFIALLLCAAMLIPTLSGCSSLLGGGDSDPEKTDETEKENTPLYLNNYYVNNHTPIAKLGGTDVFEVCTFSVGADKMT